MKTNTFTTQLLPRILLMMVVAATLLGGLGAGLARMGWQVGSLSQHWMMIHGPLMICGFLGTLISLERAVALSARHPWSIAIPAVNAAGAIALLAAPDGAVAKPLLVASSLGLLVVHGLLLRLHPLRYMVVMTLGAFSWLLGNVLWLVGYPLYQVVHLWTAFLILTIVGERLELSRVRQLTRGMENSLMGAVILYLLGSLATVITLDLGIRLAGLGALLMAIWLLRYDIARRTVYRQGVTRYIAVCLLIGYGWLAVGGLLGIWKGALYAGPDYAALLHAFLLGFVFSMIFGHAPIILPAVTGLRVEYHPIFYGHLALLHGSLAYRIYGYLAMDLPAQRWGGLLNVIAVLIFFALTVLAVLYANRRTPSGRGAVTRQPAPLALENDQMPHPTQPQGQG